MLGQMSRLMRLRRAAPTLAAALLASMMLLPADAATSGAQRAASVPAGLQPESASFLSPTRGFVLGSVGCRRLHPCQAWLVATTDGGASWHRLAVPDLRIFGSTVAIAAGEASRVVFAGRRIGWLFGPGLWVTRDGAAHWRRLTMPGMVQAMAVARRTVYAVVSPAHASTTELFSSPVGKSAWTRVGTITSAPVFSFAVFGRSVWFGSGNDVWATADGRHWHRNHFACAGAFYGLTDIAAASAARVDFLCTSTGPFNTAQEGMEVMASSDGGKTEHLAGRKAPIFGDGGAIATPPGRGAVITFAVSVGAPSWIWRSPDGGKTWKRVAFFRRGGGWTSLSYVSPSVGLIVLYLPGARITGQLLRTSDAGRTWHRVLF